MRQHDLETKQRANTCSPYIIGVLNIGVSWGILGGPVGSLKIMVVSLGAVVWVTFLKLPDPMNDPVLRPRTLKFAACKSRSPVVQVALYLNH